eukprot:scaffold221643_cov18-Tisochrysis_lutea.AAC.1
MLLLDGSTSDKLKWNCFWTAANTASWASFWCTGLGLTAHVVVRVVARPNAPLWLKEIDEPAGL